MSAPDLRNPLKMARGNRRAIEAEESTPYGDSWIARAMAALLIAMAVFLRLYVARQIAALG